MENDREVIELRRRVAFLQGTTLSVILAVLVFFALVNINLSLAINYFERIFADMLGDKPLPALTDLVITYGSGSFELALLVSVFLPLGTAIFLFRKRRQKIPWVFAVGVIFYLIVQSIVICVAMYMPMVRIIMEVNGQF